MWVLIYHLGFCNAYHAYLALTLPTPRPQAAKTVHVRFLFTQSNCASHAEVQQLIMIPCCCCCCFIITCNLWVQWGQQTIDQEKAIVTSVTPAFTLTKSARLNVNHARAGNTSHCQANPPALSVQSTMYSRMIPFFPMSCYIQF